MDVSPDVCLCSADVQADWQGSLDKLTVSCKTCNTCLPTGLAGGTESTCTHRAASCLVVPHAWCHLSQPQLQLEAAESSATQEGQRTWLLSHPSHLPYPLLPLSQAALRCLCEVVLPAGVSAQQEAVLKLVQQKVGGKKPFRKHKTLCTGDISEPSH